MTYDLIIIGAGSIGLPAALAAGRKGLKTLVLDGQASPGQGDAKTAIGGIRATHSHPGKIEISLRSINIFSKWKDMEGDNIGWRMGGYLFPVFTENDERTLKGLLEIQKSFGLDIDWIDVSEIQKLVPGIRKSGLRGGTFSPKDGSASPLLSASAFYFKAKEVGVEFKFNETVIDTKVSGGRVVSVITEKGEYACANVLNAAGAAAAKVGKQVGIDFPVYPDSHEAGITEPVERMFDPMIVDIRPTPGGKNCYFYQNTENRFEFCLTPDPIYPGTNRDSTSSFLPLVTEKIVDLLPKMKNIRVRRIWRGCYPMTPDGSPIVGSSKEIQGYHYAVGMCGQGFMLGPGLADDLVALITGEDPITPKEHLELFSFDRDFSSEEKLK